MICRFCGSEWQFERFGGFCILTVAIQRKNHQIAQIAIQSHRNDIYTQQLRYFLHLFWALKCLYGQQGFYSYGSSILCKKVF